MENEHEAASVRHVHDLIPRDTPLDGIDTVANHGMMSITPLDRPETLLVRPADSATRL